MNPGPEYVSLMAFADQRYAAIRENNDKLVAKCQAELGRLGDPVQVWMLIRIEMCRELGIKDPDSIETISVELLADLILRRAQEDNEKAHRR